MSLGIRVTEWFLEALKYLRLKVAERRTYSDTDLK
jgi:hypothetical protein